MVQKNKESSMEFTVIIVGAGAAGIGTAIVLQKLGIEYIILEKDEIGSSFNKWPEESRLISPSFTGNFFKMPDLNAVAPETSPAFNLVTEHPTGKEFAEYLEIVANGYELNIQTQVQVNDLVRYEDFFLFETTAGIYKSTYAIWAAGEYQYPGRGSFEGDELCVHFSEVDSFSKVSEDQVVVIGGYESGFDAAINLINAGKRVTLLDSANYMDLISSDSSYSLSPYTRDRIDDVVDDLQYHKETRAEKVEFADGVYTVTITGGGQFTSKSKPINCTGFATSLVLVEDLFEYEESYPLLTDFDESTKTKDLFLVGPQVKHRNALFCFIYKYRQRFAIVAQKIAEKENISQEVLEEVLAEYKSNNFYLSDLSCCDNECAC